MLSKFDYCRPQFLEDALVYLAQNAETKLLAGGTDVMVMLRRNSEMPKHMLDIKVIPETKRIEYTSEEELFIGASITVNQVSENEVVKKKYTALAQAADSLASYQLRNRATLVGNICNASPGADLSAPLLVYDAKVNIVSRQGKRTVNINEFFTGVKKTVLQQGEIVIGVTLPAVEGTYSSVYLKQTRLKGHDLGIVGVAARLSSEKGFNLAMSAVAPTPIRLNKLEELLNQKPKIEELAVWAGEQVHKYINPISDVRSSAEYRLHSANVLVKRALIQLMGKGGK